MNKMCPQHLHMGTERMKYDIVTEEEKKQKIMNIRRSKQV